MRLSNVSDNFRIFGLCQLFSSLFWHCIHEKSFRNITTQEIIAASMYRFDLKVKSDFLPNDVFLAHISAFLHTQNASSVKVSTNSDEMRFYANFLEDTQYIFPPLRIKI